MTELLSTPATTTPGLVLADPRVQRAIQLIWHEAALLDAKDYETWIDLYTEDASYVIPIDAHTEDFDNTLNMVYDDARMRRMRVNRLVEGYSISAIDSARTVRTVARFVVESVSDTEVLVRSAQVLVSFKRGTQAVLAADLTHRIALSEGGDRIAHKVVRLVNSEAAVNPSGYLL